MSGVVYEVTLQVQPAIAADFRAWLLGHVAEMLTLPGFLDARLSVPLPADADADAAVFCCQYRLRDAAALEAYLREHAPRMREQGRQRFGEGFSARRRVLQIVAEFPRA